MAIIRQLYREPIVRADIARMMEELDQKITDAMDVAVDAGVPLILIKTILESHVTITTIQMVSGDDDED